MNILGLKITTGERKDRLAIHKHDQGVKLGSARKNNSSVAVRAGLEPAVFRFHVRRPNHLARLPPQ